MLRAAGISARVEAPGFWRILATWCSTSWARCRAGPRSPCGCARRRCTGPPSLALGQHAGRRHRVDRVGRRQRRLQVAGCSSSPGDRRIARPDGGLAREARGLPREAEVGQARRRRAHLVGICRATEHRHPRSRRLGERAQPGMHGLGRLDLGGSAHDRVVVVGGQRHLQADPSQRSSHGGGFPSECTTSPSSRVLAAMRSHRPRRDAAMASSPTISSDSRSAGWRSSTPSARPQASVRRARSPARRARPASIAPAVSCSRGASGASAASSSACCAADQRPGAGRPTRGPAGGAGRGRRRPRRGHAPVTAGGRPWRARRPPARSPPPRRRGEHERGVRRLEQVGPLDRQGDRARGDRCHRRRQRVAGEAQRLDLEPRGDRGGGHDPGVAGGPLVVPGGGSGRCAGTPAGPTPRAPARPRRGDRRRPDRRRPRRPARNRQPPIDATALGPAAGRRRRRGLAGARGRAAPRPPRRPGGGHRSRHR